MLQCAFVFVFAFALRWDCKERHNNSRCCNVHANWTKQVSNINILVKLSRSPNWKTSRNWISQTYYENDQQNYQTQIHDYFERLWFFCWVFKSVHYFHFSSLSQLLCRMKSALTVCSSGKLVKTGFRYIALFAGSPF